MDGDENIIGKIENFEAFKPVPLDHDVVRMVETILKQNSDILKMNARLLSVLSAPMQLLGYHETESSAFETMGDNKQT